MHSPIKRLSLKVYLADFQKDIFGGALAATVVLADGSLQNKAAVIAHTVITPPMIQPSVRTPSTSSPLPKRNASGMMLGIIKAAPDASQLRTACTPLRSFTSGVSSSPRAVHGIFQIVRKVKNSRLVPMNQVSSIVSLHSGDGIQISANDTPKPIAPKKIYGRRRP